MKLNSRIIFFILGIAQWSFADSVVRPEDGVRLRAFTSALVQSAGAPLNERAERLRRDFSEFPEFFLWRLEGKPLDALIKAADLSLVPVSKSVAELYQNPYDFTAEWLAKSVKVLDLPAELKKMSLLTVGQIGTLLRSHGSLFDQSTRIFASMSDSERLSLLKLAPNKTFESIAHVINPFITHLEISNLESVQLLLGADQGLGPCIELLKDYFNGLAEESKRELITGLLDLGPNAPIEKQIVVLLQSAGPLVQKLFQLLADDIQSDILRASVRILLEGVQPFPDARTVLESRLGVLLSTYFSEFEDRPLAAGTVGQVHGVILRNTGERGIAKLLRPGIEEQALAEWLYLKSIVRDQALKQMIDKCWAILKAEFDFRIEGRNIQLGTAYQRPGLDLRIAGLISQVPLLKDVMVIQLAQGKSLASYKRVSRGPDPVQVRSLVTRGKLLTQLLNRWIETALFGRSEPGAGFFHGDLHAGNIFIDESASRPFLTLIDFGSSGQLTKRDQQNFISLLAGVVFSDRSEIVRALTALSGASKSEIESMKERLESVNMEAQPGVVLTEILGIPIELGIDLAEKFPQFYRGREFLDRLIWDINAQLDIADPDHQHIRFDIGRIYMSAFAKYAARDLSQQLFRSDHGSSSFRLTQVRRIVRDRTRFWLESRGLGRICHEIY